MTGIDAILAEVDAQAKGRTRYEGQPMPRDEALAAEVRRLRGEAAEARREAMEEAAALVDHLAVSEDHEMEALARFRRHHSGAGGQLISPADNLDFWKMKMSATAILALTDKGKDDD